MENVFTFMICKLQKCTVGPERQGRVLSCAIDMCSLVGRVDCEKNDAMGLLFTS